MISTRSTALKKKTKICIQNDDKQRVQDLFRDWELFQTCHIFCDLTIFGKEDFIGVSLHKAILASCSRFCTSILMDGRDQTILILPDIERCDLLCLTQILYGERTTSQPSHELLQLLGIDKLPQDVVVDEDLETTCE